MSGKMLCVGVIVGAHGIRGAVRIRTFTAEPEGIAEYGPLFDESGARRFEIEVLGTATGTVTARIEGVEDRNRAEALRGVKLFVPREALPETEEEEYYHSDLIGLPVFAPDGSSLGRLKAVFDFGAGDVLEIATADGASLMVPFTRAAVPMVDVGAGRIVVDPPPLVGEPEPGARQSEEEA